MGDFPKSGHIYKLCQKEHWWPAPFTETTVIYMLKQLCMLLAPAIMKWNLNILMLVMVEEAIYQAKSLLYKNEIFSAIIFIYL